MKNSLLKKIYINIFFKIQKLLKYKEHGENIIKKNNNKKNNNKKKINKKKIFPSLMFNYKILIVNNLLNR